MTRVERIRQNIKTLEDLRSEGRISPTSYASERNRLNNELARELGISKSRKVMDDRFDEEDGND